MKKWMTWIVALLLIFSLGCPALAAENTLTLSDAQGDVDEVLYMALQMNESISGDTMGITYQYDSTLLEPITDSCTWNIKGILQDFDHNDSGVWASGSVRDLQGTVCVLAFQIKKEFTGETAVSCQLTVKNGSQEVGVYTAAGKVSVTCSHSYGTWANAGATGHSRSCTLCGASQSQSHSWDSGVITDNPQNPSTQLKTFTCTVCGGTKSQEIMAEKEENLPLETIPVHTQPTIPVETQPEAADPTSPTQDKNYLTPPDHSQNQKPQYDSHAPDNTRPSQNSGNHSTGSQNSQNAGSQNDPSSQSSQDYHVHADGSIHYGDHEAEVTIPTEEIHDHIHETVPVVTKEARNANILLTLVIVGLMFGAGWWYLKKKKH